MSWKKIKLSEFIKPREFHYRPNAKEINNLKRIDKIDFDGNIFLSENPSKTDMILIKSGDLVISGINVYKGAIAVYEGEEDITATIHYSSYESDKSIINIEFLKNYLKSPKFLDAIKEQVPGGIKTEIKPKHLLSLEISLPNIDEQRIICKNISSIEFFNKNLKSEIISQKYLIKQLRQTFLSEAVRGKLVKQNPNDEPALELLAQIKVEKDGQIINRKLKGRRLLPIIKAEEIPFEIPESWVWCRLDEICDPLREITYGIVKLGEYVKDGVYTLRTSDVKPWYILENNIRKVSKEISNDYMRSILSGGEIIFSIRGTLGGCSIVPSKMKGYNISRELAIIPLTSKVNNKFILSVLLSPYIQNETNAKLRGIAYKGINLQEIKAFMIPLPPIEEQVRIVSKIKQLMRLCDELEKNIIGNKEQTNLLLQAVLREALNEKTDDITYKKNILDELM
jgi:type I restriction enzyme S subunit